VSSQATKKNDKKNQMKTTQKNGRFTKNIGYGTNYFTDFCALAKVPS